MFATLIALFIPPDLVDPTAGTKNFGAPSTAVRTIKFVLIGLSCWTIFSRIRLSKSLLSHLDRYFVVYLILIPMSLLWSIEPTATSARYVSLMTVVVVCFAVAVSDRRPERFQQVLRPILTVYVIAALIVGTISPEMVLEKGDQLSLKDAWHGLASQKNEFGQLASFGVILWVHAATRRESNWILIIVGGVASAACVLLSRSSTALFATLLASSMFLLLQRPPPGLRRYMPYLIGIFTVTVLTYAIAALNIVPGLGILLEPFTEITGKDMTFSNRATIWAIIKEHIQLNPILGTGYGAYWVGPVPTSPSYVFLSRMWLYPTQSHNGFLEVTDDLGFVGLAVLLAYLIGYIRQALRLMRVNRAQAALFIAVIFQQIIINLSEACWITARSASSNIMILATVCLARTLLEYQRHPTSHNSPSTPSRRWQWAGQRQ